MVIMSPSTSESSPASMVAGPLSGMAMGLAALVAAPTNRLSGPGWGRRRHGDGDGSGWRWGRYAARLATAADR